MINQSRVSVKFWEILKMFSSWFCQAYVCAASSNISSEQVSESFSSRIGELFELSPSVSQDSSFRLIFSGQSFNVSSSNVLNIADIAYAALYFLVHVDVYLY